MTKTPSEKLEEDLAVIETRTRKQYFHHKLTKESKKRVAWFIIKSNVSYLLFCIKHNYSGLNVNQDSDTKQNHFKN